MAGAEGHTGFNEYGDFLWVMPGILFPGRDDTKFLSQGQRVKKIPPGSAPILNLFCVDLNAQLRMTAVKRVLDAPGFSFLGAMGGEDQLGVDQGFRPSPRAAV